jgi:alpha-tubulin suppressor-like RCC1 family protein
VLNIEPKRRSRLRVLILGAAIAIACSSSQAHVGCSPTLTCSLHDQRFAPPQLPDAGPRACDAQRRCESKQVSAGAEHTCAVVVTGELFCWGASDDERLGQDLVDMQADGASEDRGARDAGFDSSRFTLALEHADQVAAGGAHTCAITGDSAVVCWGQNTHGQVAADLSDEVVADPHTVIEHGALQLDAGAEHTCAVLAQGVFCWGSGRYGQVGREVADRAFPPELVPGTEGAVAVATGTRHSCALMHEGSVRCWGELVDEATGEPTLTAEAALVPGLTDVRIIAAGGGQSCAGRLNDVLCWGENASGQLGDGTTEPSARPKAVPGLRGPLHLAAGGGEIDGQLVGHTCAENSDFNVLCWGRNDEGQLGNGSTKSDGKPVLVLGREDSGDDAYLNDVGELDLGAAHSCGRDNDGPVYCWGDDRAGQLGRGRRDESTPPGRIVRVARFGRAQ